MKIIVFGSTGGTGLATMRALVAAGHDVSGFARDPTKLPSSPSITPIRGDVMNAADVAAAVPGHDLVVVSLGNSQNPFALMLGARRTTPATVCETGTRHIVTAMQGAGITRLLVVTAFGIGDTRAQLPLPSRSSTGWSYASTWRTRSSRKPWSNHPASTGPWFSPSGSQMDPAPTTGSPVPTG